MEEKKKVDKFELVYWGSGIATAKISGVYSYKLFINEQKISNNLSEIEFNKGEQYGDY